MINRYILERKVVIVYALVMISVSILYLYHLSVPSRHFVFDETYYVKDAASLLRYSIEMKWPTPKARADFNFIKGKIVLPMMSPEFVVHPPLGKWAIACGLAIRRSSFFWRLPSVAAALATILITMLTAYKLYRKHIIAVFAGAILACDGIFFVMGRTAMLDIFLTFFYTLISYTLLCIFLSKKKINFLGIALLSILCGFAASIKWSGIYIYPFVLLLLLYKHFTSESRDILAGKILQIVKAIYLVMFSGAVVLLAYIVTWIGWLLSSQHSFYGHSRALTYHFLNPLLELLQYHILMFKESKSITSYHVYGSKAYTWFFLHRPVIMWSERGAGYIRQILALPTPILWFLFDLFLPIYAYLAVSSKRLLQLYPVVLLLFLYLPWLLFTKRTIFSFYSVAFSPFISLTIVGFMNMMVDGLKKNRGILISTVVLSCIVLNFLCFYPIYSGVKITSELYQHLMWFKSWK